jgi:lipopolysaccharide transport system ATP-binding protein
MSSFIILRGVTVDIPLFSSESMSLRRKLLNKNSPIQVIRALDNINLIINSGDRIGLYGHNGSGKTTLLRVLAGGYYPTYGDIEISGRVNSLIDINLGLDSEATGLHNIKLKLLTMQVCQSEYNELIKKIIDFSGLEESIYRPLRTYSSGMAMRLAFSIATSVQSDIILLDEWLSVGDEDFAEKSNKRMAEITTSSSILVIASHNFDMLKQNCNKIYLLNKGSLKLIENI